MNGSLDKSIFKAYDVRGRYPAEINEEAVKIIGEVLAGHFKKGKIVLGLDARLSSPSLYGELKRIFSGGDFDLELVGSCTTPMFYFLCNEMKAAGGIMVTASHAPKDFNGLKVVGGNGEVISGTDILKWII